MTAAHQRTQAKQSPAWRGHFRSQFVKTKMCRFYPAGLCRFGSDCCFAHTDDELSQAPDLTKTSICNAYMEGKCPLPSEQCQFAHGDVELRVTPAFVAKKLSRRTRQAGMTDDQDKTSQDGEDNSGEASGKSSESTHGGASRKSSSCISETDKTTEPPLSPSRRLSSGASTPATPPSPVARSMMPKEMDLNGPQAFFPNLDFQPNPTLCLADVLGAMHMFEPPHPDIPAFDWADAMLAPPMAAMASRPGASLEPARVDFLASMTQHHEAAKVPRPAFLNDLDFGAFAEVDPIIMAAKRSNLPLRVDI